MMLEDSAPNLWSFLTTLATGLIGLASTFLIWWTAKQNRKLDQMSKRQEDIHVLVNGNLHKAQTELKEERETTERLTAENEALKQQLENLGH